jgi:hypothetical protein
MSPNRESVALPGQTVQHDGVVAGRRLVPPIKLPSAVAGHGSKSIALEAADPLEVNALMIVAGQQRCLLVSFDLLYISGTLRSELLAELSQRHRMNDGDVFLFASHTHFAPPTDSSLPELGPVDEAYARRVRDNVLDLVDELMSKLPIPFRLEARSGPLSHSTNRRRPRFLPLVYENLGNLVRARNSRPLPRGLSQ